MFVSAVMALLFSAGALAQNSAIKPEPRDQEGWKNRHQSMNDRVKKGNVDMICIGDSITHGWEGEGKDVWEKFYAKRNAVNLGIGGDKTQHVLWRLDNGNIDGISPRLAVIMIGTNNHKENTAEEIAEGVSAIVTKLRDKLPNTKILLLGVFPREEKPGESRIKLIKVNEIISKLADNKMVFFQDIGSEFLTADGTLPKDIMPDALHPNTKGYEIWANAIEPMVAKLMEVKK
jgi:beta-glucosidase